MDLDHLLHQYFGTSDLAEASPAVQAAGVDRLRVDFGLEIDRSRRFALWSLPYMLGRPLTSTWLLKIKPTRTLHAI